MGVFRFEIGQRVRVVSHPASPVGIIVDRWMGRELGDVYGENIYEVSGFVTKQRESSLRETTVEEVSIGASPSSDRWSAA